MPCAQEQSKPMFSKRPSKHEDTEKVMPGIVGAHNNPTASDSEPKTVEKRQRNPKDKHSVPVSST